MLKRIVLWVWRWVPMPEWVRWVGIWLGNQKFLIGVAALILNDERQVLLFKHTYRIDFPWSLPGGYLKKRETAAHAIEREILEETGYEVRMTYPLVVWSSKNFARVDMVFAGHMVGGAFRPSAEVSEARFFSLQDLPPVSPRQKALIRRVLSGEPLDARQ